MEVCGCLWFGAFGQLGVVTGWRSWCVVFGWRFLEVVVVVVGVAGVGGGGRSGGKIPLVDDSFIQVY